MKKLLTIAIPTYNNQKTIAKAIDSCLSQSDLTECEVLVVNNNSSDATCEILDAYGDRIRVVHNKNTVPLFENHNIAFSEAKGDYILFCHSDDTLSSDAVKIVKNNLVKRDYPVDYIFWGHSLFRDFYVTIKNSNFTTGQVFAGLFSSNPFLEGGLSPSGTCYSKSFILNGGFFSTQHKLSPSDATSMIRVALAGFKFEMIDDILIKREGASTLNKDAPNKDVWDGYVDAFRVLFGYLNDAQILTVAESAFKNMTILPLKFLLFLSQYFPIYVFKKTCLYALRNFKIFFRPLFYRVIFSSFFYAFLNEKK